MQAGRPPFPKQTPRRLSPPDSHAPTIAGWPRPAGDLAGRGRETRLGVRNRASFYGATKRGADVSVTEYAGQVRARAHWFMDVIVATSFR